MMRAMILAAGRGERLRPHTDITPKPLIQVGEYRLIEYHLLNLARAGIREVVINVSWLREQIMEELGSGEAYGLNITYSDEGEEALETAGGIFKALPLLGDEPFLVINGDIWSDYDLAGIMSRKMDTLAHLVLVRNPEHHPKGDFALEDSLVRKEGKPRYTFSGIGLYQKDLFTGMQPGKAALGPLLRRKSNEDLVSGEVHKGRWIDIGTIERLAELRTILS